MISIRAWTEWLCPGICKAWPLATISIRALTEWLCQTICKVCRTSGNDFNQSLDRVHLPSNLQRLTFSDAFNQSLDSPWLSLWICKVWALDCVLNHGKSLIEGGFNGNIVYKWAIFHDQRVQIDQSMAGQPGSFCSWCYESHRSQVELAWAHTPGRSHQLKNNAWGEPRKQGNTVCFFVFRSFIILLHTL